MRSDSSPRPVRKITGTSLMSRSSRRTSRPSSVAQDNVQQDQVRFHRGSGPNGGATVGGDQDFMTFAGQERVEELGHLRVVIYDQNLGQFSPSVFVANVVTKP
jgi:hypothetical protein